MDGGSTFSPCRTEQLIHERHQSPLYRTPIFLEFFTQVAEVASTFNSFSPELGEIPLDIVQCYVNSSLWAAVQKMPFSIQVKLLISLSVVLLTCIHLPDSVLNRA